MHFALGVFSGLMCVKFWIVNTNCLNCSGAFGGKLIVQTFFVTIQPTRMVADREGCLEMRG